MAAPAFNPGPAGPTTPDTPPRTHHPKPAAHDPSTLAICGLSLRLPSGIHSPQSFWHLLSEGADAAGPIPPSRYNISGFDGSLGHRRGIKAHQGYFLSEDLAALDTSFFSMTRQEVEGCDPQMRKLLEVVKECLDDAGETNYRAQNVGCYVGTFGDDWLLIGAKEGQHAEGYRFIGGDMMLANRVSYEYDLKGPSMVVKTGCSASLVALHEACRAITLGDATSAIVAGTSIIMGPTTTESFTSEGILSPDGSCKTFDESANGFVRAEAINAVYVKPLAAALRDGNPVRAVIRGTGTNSDGRSKGLLQPNGQAQEMLIRKVYGDCGLDPSETAYVECHGTGTPTGDPIEANAVGNVFGQKGVYIGSVKPNVGHSEGASGLNSLIKCVLSLEHKTIPPNIKFGKPNPKIHFEENKLRVPIEPTPFPSDRKNRISINSFGIGGTNAHVILEAFEAPITPPMSPLTPPSQSSGSLFAKPSPALLLLSANTPSSLTAAVEAYKSFIAQNPQVSPSDLAYTLAFKRHKLPHRAYAIVQDGQVVETSALAKAPASAPSIYLIFSGQGAQWAGMGKELLEDEFVRSDLERMDAILQRVENPPSWSIIDELVKPEPESRIHLAEMSQPLCTALQMALLNRLTHAGIKPAAVAGHSSGEIAAAYAAGALSMEAAIIAAYYRGWVTTKQTLDGSMAAIGLGPEETAKFLVDGVVVACENSPSSVTISGDTEKVLEVVAKVKETMPDVLARPLKVNMAYHSHHMGALGDEYVEHLRREFAKLGIYSGRPSTAFISSVTGLPMDSASTFGPEYWLANLVSPVKFSPAVTTLLEARGEGGEGGDGLFVEIGPHAALAGPLRQICSAVNKPCQYVSALKRGDDSGKSFMSALGRLFQEGVPINLMSFYPGANTLSDLPRYAWDHSQSHWYESRVAQAWRFRKFAHHPVLGDRVSESPDAEPQWRNMLYLDDIPWVADHKVRQDIVFPMAGYIAIAGEAVRQITGCDEGYSLRHAVAKTALVLNESKGVEVMTTLRKHKLTDTDDSDWYEFRIVSYAGSTWVTHCDGQVKAMAASPAPARQVEDLPRPVSSTKFYQYIADSGIIFGPQFKTLDKASASVTGMCAKADIVRPSDEESLPYALHPTSIDAVFQLTFLAEAQGLCRNLTTLKLPTLIDSIDIYRGSGNLTATAWSHGKAGTEGAECVSDGKTVIRLSGFHTTPVGAPDLEYDLHAAARLEWLPDFDFVDPAPLFKPGTVDRAELRLVEELTFLCMLESRERLEGLTPCQPHFNKMRQWLDIEKAAGEAGQNSLVPHAPDLVALPRDERKQRIESLYDELMAMGKVGFTRGLRRIVDNCDAIFTGSAETIDVLIQDGVLAELYDIISFGYGDFVRLLSSTKPTLRILEVGAGTGGTTELLLRDLVHEGGLPRYSTYTFTDVSSGFFPAAKERFAYAANMEYKVFDISKDPLEQDFEVSSYDLIIAANVVHATPSLKESLANLNKLLKPQGILILTEIHTEVRSATYIFGNFSGWWLGENDGREYMPYVDSARWDKELRASGYTGVDTVVYDDEAPYTCCTTIMSRRVWDPPVPNAAVSLISSMPGTGVAKSIQDALEAQRLLVNNVKLGQDLPEDQDIIACIDIETKFFDDISDDDFKSFQSFIKSLKTTQKILWLTSPAQINCKDPRSAGIIGISRTLRSEREVPFHTLEIEESEEHFASLVLNVFDKIRSEEDGDNLACDKEFAVSDGTICIGRYHPFPLTRERCERSIQGANTSVWLEATKPGSIDVCWREHVMPPLPDDCVELDVKACGINLHDVLVMMGLIPAWPNASNAGIEVAGVVCRVGPKVEGINVGDRVFGISPKGSMMTRSILRHQGGLRKIPDSMSFREAATIPVVFATVIQGLLNMGRLEKGQSVLIHSACGGVGLAAIQVAQMVGAEIYATVGSQEKIDYLMTNFGMPRNRIFNSRDESFYDGVMRETDGRGVDVVLNSLAGTLLEKSWNLVAPFGIMVEIGKRDGLGHAKLDMNPFLANRTYYCLDVRELASVKPEKVGQILDKFLNCYEIGLLRPLPVQYFSARDAEAAYRFVQGGSHIGKAVIDMTVEAPIPTTPSLARMELDPAATYLLTGGFGGLGRSMATWMVEHGARHLTLLSRSAASEASNVFVRELEAMGCAVVAVEGKADRMEDVERAVRDSKAPIKGVFHMAMLLLDAELADMTWEQWNGTFQPKVKGAWNLHHAVLDQPLDYFFLASSIVSMTHQIGQGNYSAANTVLEAMCQYRLQQGLPASVLNISPIKGVGFVAETAYAQRSMKMQGIYELSEAAYLDYVELSMLTSKSQLKPGPSVVPPVSWTNPTQIIMGLRSELDLEDPNNRTNWRRDRRMGSYHNIRTSEGEVSGDSSGLRVFLNNIAGDVDILSRKESKELLAREVGNKVFNIMLKPDAEVDVGTTLAQMGLDSLMATELRRWFRQVFGLHVSVLEIMGSGSLLQFADTIAQALKTKIVEGK